MPLLILEGSCSTDDSIEPWPAVVKSVGEHVSTVVEVYALASPYYRKNSSTCRHVSMLTVDDSSRKEQGRLCGLHDPLSWS